MILKEDILKEKMIFKWMCCEAGGSGVLSPFFSFSSVPVA